MSFSLNTSEFEPDLPLRDGRLREFLETAERRRPQLLRMARRLTQCHEDAGH